MKHFSVSACGEALVNAHYIAGRFDNLPRTPPVLVAGFPSAVKCRPEERCLLPYLPGGTEVSAARPCLFRGLFSTSQAAPGPTARPGLGGCLSVFAAAPISGNVLCCSCPGTFREGGRQGRLGYWKSQHPVMGRSVHVIFREFQEVFGSRLPTVRHKESTVYVAALVALPHPGRSRRCGRCQGSGQSGLLSAGANE